MNEYQKVVKDFFDTRKQIHGTVDRLISPYEVKVLMRRLEDPKGDDYLFTRDHVNAESIRHLNRNSNLHTLIRIMADKDTDQISIFRNFNQYVKSIFADRNDSVIRATYLDRLKVQIKRLNKHLGRDVYSLVLTKDSHGQNDFRECYVKINTKNLKKCNS